MMCMTESGIRLQVPSVGATSTLEAKNHFFANSRTLTYADFCNYFHTDHDESCAPFVYSLWWVTCRAANLKKWVLNNACGHALITGGEFLVPEYHVGVDFAKYAVLSISLSDC
jgi:hypothetical protein